MTEKTSDSFRGLRLSSVDNTDVTSRTCDACKTIFSSSTELNLIIIEHNLEHKRVKGIVPACDDCLSILLKSVPRTKILQKSVKKQEEPREIIEEPLKKKTGGAFW